MNGCTSSILGSSRGPKHHFFGFHDLIAWNADETRIACLEVDRIDHIPLSGQRASIGYLDAGTYDFVSVTTTAGFNFPQGSRQQWWGETNHLIFNDQVGDNWGSCIYDTDTGKCVQKLTSTAHVVSPLSGSIFGINYARLFRLGAYGYNGLKDRTADEKVPNRDGIFKNSTAHDKPELLVSIADVVNVQKPAGAESYENYLTHLVLSPDERRIAFLHRFRTGEGELTRMMTVGVDGSGLRCLATGFLSHFDWQDNDHIVIWGRIGSAIERMRTSRLYSHVPPGLLRIAKKTAKTLFMGGKGGVSGFKWHALHDSDTPTHSTVADGVIMEDGHPMFCPVDRDWMICDHYPHADGIRTLFLYQVSRNKRIDLGTYKMLNARVDPVLTKEALALVSPEQIRLLTYDSLTFTRSGLHCDLHPRWDRSGTKVAFDSIHEGTRQLYVQDVRGFLGRNH
jgi:hypothetical protein